MSVPQIYQLSFVASVFVLIIVIAFVAMICHCSCKAYAIACSKLSKLASNDIHANKTS